MSKKVKVLISVVAAVLLLTVGATTAVMAQEEPEPTPEAGANGLLARVAEILDIPNENLESAFRQARQEMMQARQEMREEACIRSLDKAVEEGCITQEEANAIKEWWEQKPEVMDSGQFGHALGSQTLRRGHSWGGPRGWGGLREWHCPEPPSLADQVTL